MSNLYRRLETDRQMRDSARKLVEDGVRNLRGDVEEQGVGARMAVRLREGAEGVGGDLATYVRNNPARTGSTLALGAGLLLAWIFRDRLAQWVDRPWLQGPTDPEPAAEEHIGAVPHSTND